MLKFNIFGCLIVVSLVNGIPTDFRKHPNWPKSATEICGESFGDRITGGKYAALGQYPWMARILVYSIDEDTFYSNCGGTLISEQYVLTASHCKPSRQNSILGGVILGDYNMDTNPDCDEGICANPHQFLRITNVFTPAPYDHVTKLDDIMLLKLEIPALFNLCQVTMRNVVLFKKMKNYILSCQSHWFKVQIKTFDHYIKYSIVKTEYSDWVMPICLPTGLETFGNSAEIAGWGLTKGDGSYSPILKFAKIPIVSNGECYKRFATPITTSQICAGNTKTKEDTCGGDSGGPLMQIWNSEYGPRYYLVGVVSYGDPECGESPGVYTNVSTFIPFILKGMKLGSTD